jgi:predicted regulator of Ras-like GTPase activity (Roadblock/LC7/MglB family)
MTSPASDRDTSPARRGEGFREALRELVRLDHVRGGALVAPDGFVIAAELPAGVPVDSLAALAATLGRELEVGATRLERGAVLTALFAADDGAIVLGASQVGFLVLIADRELSASAARTAMRKAIATIHEGWASS